MESKTLKQERKRRTFTKEFKDGAVRLVLEEGKSRAQVGRDLGVYPSVIGQWVKQAEIDQGKGRPGAITTAERQELSELRKKVRVLEMERALLKKAAALKYPHVREGHSSSVSIIYLMNEIISTR